MKKPELLAPAGSMSTLKAAVDAGTSAHVADFLPLILLIVGI